MLDYSLPDWPHPSPAADELSHRLTALIMAEIGRQGGWLSFADYMEMALYQPGLGYYSAGASKFGESGDFVTAPEIGALFGKTIARQVAQILTLPDNSNVLELGAGSGQLAVDLLGELERLGCLPHTYFILERSADLRQRQQQQITAAIPHLASRVQWLEQLAPGFKGVILANEVLDALPVHLIKWQDDLLFEQGVAVNQGELVKQDKLLEHALLKAMAAEIEVPADYLSEISLAVPALIRSLADCLEQGVILLIDYGFPRREYYHPQRNRGTLMCHYRHRAHDNPFYLPGLQDITAHVDFSQVAEAGIEEGLNLLGYTSQAQFLINCGITDQLNGVDPSTASNYLPLAGQVNRLISPAEMGELFKVIALGKQVETPLLGFAAGDRSYKL